MRKNFYYEPYIVHFDADSTCSSLIHTPENGNIFAETYVGVENISYTYQ